MLSLASFELFVVVFDSEKIVVPKGKLTLERKVKLELWHVNYRIMVNLLTFSPFLVSCRTQVGCLHWDHWDNSCCLCA